MGLNTPVESTCRLQPIKNPDKASFSVEIPKEYKEYEIFTVTLVDRYELKYQKEIDDVKSKGSTGIVIYENDYV